MDEADIQQSSRVDLVSKTVLDIKDASDGPPDINSNTANYKRILGFKIRTTGTFSKQELKPAKQPPRSQALQRLPSKYAKLPALPPKEKLVTQQVPLKNTAAPDLQRPKPDRIQRVRCGSRQKVKPSTTLSDSPPGLPMNQIGPTDSLSEPPVPPDEFEQRVTDLIKRLLPTQPAEDFLQDISLPAPLIFPDIAEKDPPPQTEQEHQPKPQYEQQEQKQEQPKPQYEHQQQPKYEHRQQASAHTAAPKAALAPVSVQTFFSRGEFKLFKYLFHLRDWKRVNKPSLAQYLHYPRERDTDWLQAGQRVVSNIPGIEQFCKKREHSWFANRLKQLHPDLNWYYPDTFILPEEQQEYVEAHAKLKEDIYIAKMSGSRQGVGVRVLAKPSDLSLLCGPQEKGFTTAVVQKYINEPLLLKGIKSDLRLYLMITSIDPPIAFLNREGLARFCTEPYVKPTVLNTNKLDPSSQLTNFTMNKGNKNFQATYEIEAENEGTKRTLISYWKSVKADANLEPTIIWTRIEKLAQRLLKTMMPHLRMCLEQQKNKIGLPATSTMQLMHIVGLDVILDAEGHPWLLEVNSMPSMAIESSEVMQEEKNPDARPEEPKPKASLANSKIDTKPKGGRQEVSTNKDNKKTLVRSKTTNPMRPTDNTAVKPVKTEDTKPAEHTQKANMVDVYVKTQ